MENILQMPSKSAEFCENCGQEWPVKFGRHNCNYHRAFVHNKAIVINPLELMRESVERLASRMYTELCRSAEMADCAGEEPPYRYALADIDATIGKLKRFRAEIQQLAGHGHDWSEDDYCRICGADGRA